MSETQTQIEDLPEINYEDIKRSFHYPNSDAFREIESLTLDEGYPGFVVPESGRVPSSSITKSIGLHAVEALNRHTNANLRYTPESTNNRRKVSSPEHFDGLFVDPFVQIHTNLGPANTEVIISRTDLNSAQQQDLLSSDIADSLEARQYLYNFVARLESMPASVKYAPVVARYRAYLSLGDSLVFRNGFNVLSTSQDAKSMFMHDFHSVDKDGNAIYESDDPDNGRLIQVGYLAPVLAKAKKHGGFISKLRRKK